MDKQDLRYYLTMFRYNTDPVIKVHYLVKIKELFPKTIPVEIKEFLKKQQKLMGELLEKEIDAKKSKRSIDHPPQNAGS